MALTPPVAHLARRWALALRAREADDQDGQADLPKGLGGHVVIAGYGRVGQMLGSILDAQGLPYLALDTNSTLVGRFRRQGGGIFFGDARRPDILKVAHTGRASALVVTMDSPVAAERVVEIARRRWPDLPIYARARDAVHARRLLGHGASHVIPETVEASLQISELVLTGAGIPEETARHLVDVRRRAEQAALDARPDSGKRPP